ncbi:MAG: class I SAM-dependent methyltransferase [Promethearchaeota archaeon]
MSQKNQHYSTKYPDVKLKVYTISESLRRHLYIFKTATGVFSFKKIDLGTQILIEHMTISKDPSVLLDLGCGYGSIGIVLGYESPQSQIYFIDINKRAIWCSKQNIKINFPENRNRFIVLNGNYLEPIKRKNIKFDGIYMNPPMRKGRSDFLKLMNEIPSVLKPNGFFQFVIKKKMGASYIENYLINHFQEDKYNFNILCKRSGYWVFNLRLNN